MKKVSLNYSFSSEKLFVHVLLSLATLFTVACSPDSAKQSSGTSSQALAPLQITDDGGRELTIAKRPETIVSLAPSLSEMVIALGDTGMLRGVTKWCDRPEAAEVERIGDMTSPDMERIIGLRPDLVLGTEMTPRHVYDTLDAAGVTCMMFKHQGLQDVMDDMTTLADVLGQHEQGQAVIAAMEARRAKILARVAAGKAGAKVALLYDFESMGSAGKGSWVDDLLSSLGLDNIANRASSSWPRLSREALLTEQPLYIILPLPLDEAEHAAFRAKVDALKDDPVWGKVQAVQNGGIIFIPGNLLNIPGPRTLDAMDFIADHVYGRGK